MRRYLVKCAYLLKGALEAVLGDVRLPGHGSVTVNGPGHPAGGTVYNSPADYAAAQKRLDFARRYGNPNR